MIDRDRFSDEYDPEPDYDRPSTVAEAEADEAGMPEVEEAEQLTLFDPAPYTEEPCSSMDAQGRTCCYRQGHDLAVFPHRYEYDDEHARLIEEMHASERASDDNREMYR